jgi:hypothetical protein
MFTSDSVSWNKFLYVGGTLLPEKLVIHQAEINIMMVVLSLI